jgi:hypothetical protein
MPKWVSPVLAVISAVAAVFVYLSSNKAEDAVSNLASWWEWGNKTMPPPAWLQSAYADQTVFWGALAVIVGSLAGFLRPWRWRLFKTEWISLTDAARRAYGRTPLDGLHRISAERFGGSEDAVLTWYAHALVILPL